jgi:tRNA G18 (ribose-2'-O)-methylase SpoU
MTYDQFDYNPPLAIVMGTESTGLDKLWIEETNQNLIIPMADEVDSLNLSVSAGILMYESQRKNNRF